MTEEREPDGFKIAAEHNIAAARRAARIAPKKTPQEQELLKHHRIMMTAAHNGVLATFSAMHPAVQKAVVNWHDPDPKTNGWTALMSASSKGHVEIVKHLLSIGADVSLVDDTGRGAIDCAARDGRAAVITALLEAGADLNRPCPGGWTPLMESALAGHADATRIFLERGADTRVEYPRGGLIRTEAIRRGHHAIAALIDAEEKKRGAIAAANLVEKGTAETITVSRRPLKLKPNA
ncbi:MAG: ankyrin repeat domain-containing protein [Alphaproteobacteria bacterium]